METNSTYITYCTLKELMGKTLKKGDHVKIGPFELVTEEDTFVRFDGKNAGKIFYFLFLNKRKFFGKHFGEEPVLLKGFSVCRLKNKNFILTSIAVSLLERYENNKFLYDFLYKEKRGDRKKKKMINQLKNTC